MSTYTIEQLEGEPIITAVCHADFKASTDFVVLTMDIRQRLDDAAESFYVIMDIERVAFNLDDMVAAANIARQSDLSLFNHPHVKDVIMVTTNKVILTASKGLNSPIFGNIHLRMFSSLDEAISDARAR